MATANRYHSNYHARVIAGKIEELFPEIVSWGEAEWWPKDSLMSFSRKVSGPVVEGTEYIQKVKLPFGPSWRTVVSEIKNNESITRKFKEGFFEGCETVSIKPLCCHNVKIEYEMLFRIKGLINRILWKVIFRRLHDRNIEYILDNLKAYAEKAPQGCRSGFEKILENFKVHMERR